MKTNKPKTKPKFEHDCEQCIFLGHVTIDGVEGDVYCHENNREPEMVDLLVRFSDEPSDNSSTIPSCCTPISPWSMIMLALYVKHLGADAGSCCHDMVFTKDKQIVLRIRRR